MLTWIHKCNPVIKICVPFIYMYILATCKQSISTVCVAITNMIGQYGSPLEAISGVTFQRASKKKCGLHHKIEQQLII